MAAARTMALGILRLRVRTPVRLQTYRYLETGPKGTYIAKYVPAYVQVEEGKKYSWCKCGLSKKQPFCDGSHKGTEWKPVRFQADATKRVLLCRCKQTSNEPYCDMTHSSIIMQTVGKKLSGLFGGKS